VKLNVKIVLKVTREFVVTTAVRRLIMSVFFEMLIPETFSENFAMVSGVRKLE